MMHAEQFDTNEIVLSNGKIVDGCGNPWFWGDLSIQDGRIASIGRRGNFLEEVCDADQVQLSFRKRAGSR